MQIEDLRNIALNLKGSTEDIKWEDHLCFTIGGKMYLVTSPDQVPSTASFKVTPEEYEALLAQPGFQKHSHLARYHWVHLNDLNRLSKNEWQHFIRQSYELVAAKLPKKVKKELNILIDSENREPGTGI
ncbi:MmcQ/YjbR family DNA-binding protein [Adhaeribacter arboris]|nr:MmcQ/YjbR family DNA-binding protein [Adhaeribacter arboris]